MKKISILFLILLCNCTFLYAQQFSITGVVTDKKLNEPKMCIRDRPINTNKRQRINSQLIFLLRLPICQYLILTWHQRVSHKEERSRLPHTCLLYTSVPSFLIKLIEFAEKNHIDYHHCFMQKGVCIGEALRNPDFTLNTLGKRIHEKWDSLQLYSTYASTEMQSLSIIHI